MKRKIWVLLSVLIFITSLCGCKKVKDIPPGTYVLEKNLAREMLDIDIDYYSNGGGHESTTFNINVSSDPIYYYSDGFNAHTVEGEYEDAYIEVELTANGSTENHKIYLDSFGNASEEIIVSHKVTSDNKCKHKVIGYGGYYYSPLYSNVEFEIDNIEYKYERCRINNSWNEPDEYDYFASISTLPNTKTWIIPEYVNVANQELAVYVRFYGHSNVKNDFFGVMVNNIVFEGPIDGYEYDFLSFKHLELVAFKDVKNIEKLNFLLPEGEIDFYVDTENQELMQLLKNTYYVGNIYPYSSLNYSNLK